MIFDAIALKVFDAIALQVFDSIALHILFNWYMIHIEISPV